MKTRADTLLHPTRAGLWGVRVNATVGQRIETHGPASPDRDVMRGRTGSPLSEWYVVELDTDHEWP